MIGTGDNIHTAPALKQPHAAMPTDVGIGPNATVTVTHDDHRLITDGDCHIHARLSNLGRMTDSNPARGKDTLLFSFEKCRISIIPARHAVRMATILISDVSKKTSLFRIKCHGMNPQADFCWSKNEAPLGSSGIGIS